MLSGDGMKIVEKKKSLALPEPNIGRPLTVI
jgi:hypothetical protein